MKPRLIVFALIAAVAASAAGYWLHARQLHRADTPVGLDLPADTVLQDLDGQRHHFADWHGKLLLVNFWATWCTPCLDEIPDLIKAQQRYGAQGLQIIGPAVDDADSVRKMQSKMGMSYPILIGTPEQLLGLMTQLGNTAGGLPYSVLADGNGHVLAMQLGQFEPGQLKTLLEQHLPAH